MVGVAQLVSAPDCGSGGRGFESLHPPHFLMHRSSKEERVHYSTPDGCDTGLSPSGKAPDFDSGIRRFKSCQPSHNFIKYDSLAQLVEQRPFKAKVRGSSPRRVTKKQHRLLPVLFFHAVGREPRRGEIAPAGAFRGPTERSKALGAEMSPAGHQKTASAFAGAAFLCRGTRTPQDKVFPSR